MWECAAQASAFESSDATPAAVSQHVSAMASRLSPSPDEVNDNTKINATVLANDLARSVSPVDTSSIQQLLVTLSAMASTSLYQLAAAKATSRHRRLLLGDYHGAQVRARWKCVNDVSGMKCHAHATLCSCLCSGI